jgi:hypothetical protein
MATSGTNGTTGPSKRSNKVTAKATAAPLRAMREYLKMTGRKFDPKRRAKTRAQWAD